MTACVSLRTVAGDVVTSATVDRGTYASRYVRSIDDQDYCQPPQRHAAEQRAIPQQHVRWTSAPMLAMHEVQVPENAVDRERSGQHQPAGAEPLRGLRACAIDDVDDKR